MEGLKNVYVSSKLTVSVSPFSNVTKLQAA